MKYISYFVVTVLLMYICIGCSDKKLKDNQKNISIGQEKLNKEIKNNFEITNIDGRSTTITINGNRLFVAKARQPIVLINIFAQWSPPSRGMIPYLDILQKKYVKDILVIGVLVNSNINNQELKRFMKEHNANYLISNSKDNEALALKLVDMVGLDQNYPIPLTIIFNNNKYNRHYVGAIPIEMIYMDIKQISNSVKK